MKSARNIAGLVLVCLAGFGFPVLGQAARAEGATEMCVPRGARVLAATPSSVVYRSRTGPSSRGTFGCLKSLGRNRWLGDGRGRERFLGAFALGRDRVGYGLTLYENSREDVADQQVRVLDLRTGALILKVPAVSVADPESPNARGGVHDIAMSGRGSLAWIAANTNTSPATFELWTSDTHGTQMLDAGPDILPTSLAVSGARFYWTRAGRPMTTTLEGTATK